ncbi:MAG: alpha/beta hydrolase [Pseudomonadota bacterium]
MLKRLTRHLFPALLLGSGASAHAQDECVVLLHGLARSTASMQPMAKALRSEGYRVANIGYPSRQQRIEALAPKAVARGLAACRDANPARIHFVTHSLGSILVRHYFEQHPQAHPGRVVMLGPPNQGSHVVDDWRQVPGYRLVNGPAGMQLGTDPNSLPRQLGPVSFELGVIAGTRSVNPILSRSLPNPDDGKVHVENTKVAGMADHIEMPHSHTFMMRSAPVIRQTLHFLSHGRFDRS